MHQTFPKPIRGEALLARRERRSVALKLEQAEMRAAKRRDGGKCRWPNCKYAKKDLPIDAAHFLQHRGAGGNPDGSRTTRSTILSLCRIHHSLLDHCEINIQPMTDANADGPLAFFQLDKETGRMEHVATESRRGVPETRGA
jgi:hypothetical protein